MDAVKTNHILTFVASFIHLSTRRFGYTIKMFFFALNILFLIMLFYHQKISVNAKHITGNVFAILKSSLRESAMELNGKKFYKLFNKLFFVHIEEIVYGNYIGFRIIKKKQSS